MGSATSATWLAQESATSEAIRTLRENGYTRIYSGQLRIHAYDSDRGVGIEYRRPSRIRRRSHRCQSVACQSFADNTHRCYVHVRHKGHYRHYSPGLLVWSGSLQEALELAAKLVGDKQSKTNRFRKIVPTISAPVWHKRHKRLLLSQRQIIRVEVIGCCQISPNGTVTTQGVERPGTNPFFLVWCADRHDRLFYVVLNCEGWFYVAAPRGSVIKLLATDILWDSGDRPFDVRKISVQDIELVMTAVQAFCSAGS